MKSEKGLSLLGTIFLIFIIAILAFGVVYFIRMQTAKENLEDLKTDMLLVQAKVKNIVGKYTLEKKEEVLVGTKLSELKEDETIKNFLAINLFDPEEKDKKYYVLNNQNLSDLELKQVTVENGAYYIVEYTESQVYYTKGFTYSDGVTYYKITDIENLEAEK